MTRLNKHTGYSFPKLRYGAAFDHHEMNDVKYRNWSKSGAFLPGFNNYVPVINVNAIGSKRLSIAELMRLFEGIMVQAS